MTVKSLLSGSNAETTTIGTSWRCVSVDTVPTPFTTSTGKAGYIVNTLNSHALFIGSTAPVAQLTFDNGGENKVAIQLNKKLNLAQRLVYWVLGFSYKKL